MFSEEHMLRINSDFSHSSMARNNYIDICLSKDEEEIKFKMTSFNQYNSEEVNSVVMKRSEENKELFDAIKQCIK